MCTSDHRTDPTPVYLAERHTLIEDGEIVEVFEVQFTQLQRQALTLLGVSERPGLRGIAKAQIVDS